LGHLARDCRGGDRERWRGAKRGGRGRGYGQQQQQQQQQQPNYGYGRRQQQQRNDIHDKRCKTMASDSHHNTVAVNTVNAQLI